MRYLILFYIVCCLVSSGRGQEKSLSLTDCMELAVRNNPTLLRSELQLSRDKLNLQQAKYERLPSLNASAGHSWSQGRTLDQSINQYVDVNSAYGSQGINASLPIFTGFGILHDTRMKANAKEAGKLEYEGSVNELKLDVIEAYLGVLMAEDILNQSIAQLEVTKEQMRRAEVMQKEGAYSPGDYYDLKGQFSMEQNAIENNQQSHNISRSRLASLLNIAVEDLPGIEAVSTTDLLMEYIDAESLFAQAQQSVPNIKALDWRIKEAKESIKVAQSNLWPSLSLNGGFNTNYSSSNSASYFSQMQNNIGKTLSLNLQVPLFNRMRNRTQVKQMRLNMQDAIYSREVQLNTLRQETANVIFNLTALRGNINNLQTQVEAFEESFRIATVHFENGNSNSYIFLNAKTRYDNARSQLVVKEYEWLLQKYINDYYAGNLGW